MIIALIFIYRLLKKQFDIKNIIQDHIKFSIREL